MSVFYLESNVGPGNKSTVYYLGAEFVPNRLIHWDSLCCIFAFNVLMDICSRVGVWRMSKTEAGHVVRQRQFRHVRRSGNSGGRVTDQRRPGNCPTIRHVITLHYLFYVTSVVYTV